MKAFAVVLSLLLAATDAFVAKSTFVSSSSRLAARTSTAPATTLRMLADDPKVVLITGSSRGLGRSMALEIGKYGHKIVVVYYTGLKDEGEGVVEEVKALGGDAVALECDTSKLDSIQKLFDDAVAKFGTVDVLINNAGITMDNLVVRMKPEQWQTVIDVNLSGVFYCTQAFFKIASKNRSGRIVNIASVVGQFGNPGQANYGAAKGGVIGLTYCNAKEFSSRNVCVNAICPGFIESAMTAKLTPEYLKEMADAIPLKRLGKPEEVAGMARFLALDPAAGYITGHTFNVDGGIAIGC